MWHWLSQNEVEWERAMEASADEYHFVDVVVLVVQCETMSP